MSKRLVPLMFVPALLFAGAATAQDYPVLDEIAQKVIAKYQNATCEQLWEKKAQGQPKSEREQKAIQLLQSDPSLQQAFFSQVAAPIVTKMFQCGMIP